MIIILKNIDPTPLTDKVAFGLGRKVKVCEEEEVLSSMAE